MRNEIQKAGDPSTITFVTHGGTILAVGLCGQIARELTGSDRYDLNAIAEVAEAFGKLEADGYKVRVI